MDLWDKIVRALLRCQEGTKLHVQMLEGQHNPHYQASCSVHCLHYKVHTANDGGNVEFGNETMQLLALFLGLGMSG